MRLVVESTEVEAVIGRLARRDASTAADARAAVEWLSRGEEEDAPAVFTRRRLQVFLWYELPHKWLVSTDEHLAVAEALAVFFDQFGPEATGYATLCRDPETVKLVRDGGEGFVEAVETSGLEPPDTPVLEWSDLMTIEEALERDAVAEMLEQAVDERRLVPGSPMWKERQSELVETYLITPQGAEGTPLSRILTARRKAWLDWFTDRAERAFVEGITPQADEAPTIAEAEAALEPLLWLLGHLAEGVKLTQTGALPRVLVREVVGRYPDWWDAELFGQPQREADVYPLEVLHTIALELRLARPRRGVLQLAPRGRALRADPLALLSTVASAIAANGGSRDLDLALATLLGGKADGFDFRLIHLLGPFYGIVGGRFRREVELTPAGRTLAAAILQARAYGPRHAFA